MKKIFTVFLIFFCLTLTISSAEDQETQTNGFYYSRQGDEFRISLNGSISKGQEAESLILGFYSDSILIRAEVIRIDEAVSDLEVNNLVTSLPGAPQDVTVKAFLWSEDGKCVPVSTSTELSDIPQNTYEFYGRVVNTCRTTSVLNDDEVQVHVEQSDDFAGTVITADDPVTYEMNIGDTDIDNHFREYMKMYCVYDKWADSFKIVRYEPLEHDNTVTIKTSDIEIADDGTPQWDYEFGDDVELFINGVKIYLWNEDVFVIAGQFIKENKYPNANVKLIDETNIGSTECDGKYDLIMIECYGRALVESAEIQKYGDSTILFSESTVGAESLTYNKNDHDNMPVNFYDKREKKLDYSAAERLEQGDELYIAYDVSNGWEWSYFYDIIINRNIDNLPIPEKEFSFDAKTNAYINTYNGVNTFCGSFLPSVTGKAEDYVINLVLYKNNTAIYNTSIPVRAGTEVNEFSGAVLNCDEVPDAAELIVVSKNTEFYKTMLPVVSAQTVTTLRGRIINTANTSSELTPGEVMLLDEAVKWNPVRQVYKSEQKNNVLYRYGEFKISGDTIISFMPLADDEVILTPKDIRLEDSHNMYTRKQIPVYASDASPEVTVYRLSDDFWLYINGVRVESIDNTTLSEYLLSSQTVSITLIDETELGSTSRDGYYDCIFVEYNDTDSGT